MIHQMKATSVSSQHLRHTTGSNEINKTVAGQQYRTSPQKTHSSSQPTARRPLAQISKIEFHHLFYLSSRQFKQLCIYYKNYNTKSICVSVSNHFI